MYKISTIQTALSQLVGFRGDASESGLFFEDAHPLVTTENIEQSLPKGQYADQAAMKAALVNTAVSKVVASAVSNTKSEMQTKALLAQTPLFYGSGKFNNLIVKRSRFVGFRLCVKQEKSLSVIIRKIGVQFVSAQPEGFNLYLYDPTGQWKALPVSGNDAVVMSWSDANETLLQGTYYLGYFEDDLTGQAVDKNDDLNNPCRTCNPQAKSNQLAWSRWLEAKAISYPGSAFDETGNLADYSLEREHTDTNFGLNIEFSAECDYTQFITDQKHLFAEALQYQLAVDALEIMAYSTRNNTLQLRLDKDAHFALSPNEGKFRDKAAEKLKTLAFDVSGLNSVCHPCKAIKRPRYGVIG